MKKSKSTKVNYNIMKELNANDFRSKEVIRKAELEYYAELVGYGIVAALGVWYYIKLYITNISALRLNPVKYVNDIVNTGQLNRQLAGGVFMAFILVVSLVIFFETRKETPADYLSERDVAYINKVSYRVSNENNYVNIFIGSKDLNNTRRINKVK